MKRLLFQLLAWLAILCGVGLLRPQHSLGQETIFSDNFGSGQGDWNADNGVWQVGASTRVSESPASGGNMAGTVLNGNYPNGANSHLISPDISLPMLSSGEELQLRFWHWFDTWLEDPGQVQISVAGGTWQTISRSFTWASNGWSRQIVDLSAFAGQQVRIAFLFTSNNSSTELGWYIDDVSIVRGQFSFPNPEDFSAGIGDWNADNGVWQVGASTRVSESPASGGNMAGTVLNGNYPNRADARLISPQITLDNLVAGEELQLRFWHWFDTWLEDPGQVQISVAGGTWQTISRSFTWASNGWSRQIVDLSAFAGQQVRIAFLFTSNNSSTELGWYIDDVSIVRGQFSFPNPEDFSAGIGDWNADNGVWQVGASTRVSESPASGGNMAGTVLNGNYPNRADARLISPQITLDNLVAGEELQLRFWHWFDTWLEDPGQVQISVAGGTWQTISRSFTWASNGWSRQIVDLSAFAGQQVRIAFLFTSNNSSTELGWYIDDVSIVRGQFSFPNPEDFSAGIGDWNADNGVWQVGASTRVSESPASGGNMAGTVLNGNYPNRADARLISPEIPLTPAPGETPRLRFQHWFSTFAEDEGSVQISLDGENWETIAGPFSVSSGSWSQFTVNLSAYANATVRIAFLFTSNTSSTALGWYIDDVSIEGITTSSLSASPSELSFGDVLVGQSTTRQVTVSNTGTEGLNVTAAISGADASRFGVNTASFSLAVGASRTLDVTFTPNAVGSDTASLGIQSSGGNASVPLSGNGVGSTTFTRITTGTIVNDGGSSAGSSWGDYDNDGDLDLFVTNGEEQTNLLYRNNGDGTFTKVTSGIVVNDLDTSGSEFAGSSVGIWGDYNNDSNLDLFVANWLDRNNFLYRNNGSGVFSFSKVTTGSITSDGGNSLSGSWGDYDNDGDLDLFVANFGGQNNFLYRNDGNGTFTRITSNPVVSLGGNSASGSWGDYDNDGDLDLFVANGGDPSNSVADENNFLYKNDGDGTFTRITTGSIVNDGGKSNGASWGDFDNDGDLDLFVTNSANQNNFLYSNNGDGTFTRITSGPLVNDGGESTGSAWGDFDNDGDLDLFVSNDHDQNNFLYDNGNGVFTRIITGPIVEDQGRSVSSVWGDYDNDGDLDLYVAQWQRDNALFRNDGNSNNWINIKCVGTVSNTSAIGAKVRVKATIGGRTVWQLQEISSQTGFRSQNSLNAEFGLGDATVIDSLVIEWPSGIVQVLEGVQTNQFLILEEAESRITVRDINRIPQAQIDELNQKGASLTTQEIQQLIQSEFADQRVSFTAALLSAPLNSGLASVNNGRPSRLHIFLRDVLASTLGNEGMTINVVDENYEANGWLNASPGDVFDVTGTITYFISEDSALLQFAPDSVTKVGTVQSMGLNASIMEPVLVTTSDINRQMSGGEVQINWNNLSNLNGQYVRLENVTIVERMADNEGRAAWTVTSDGGVTLVYADDISLRFRNDRTDYPSNFNRRDANNPFVPPEIGVKLNLQGFLNFRGFDPFSIGQPAGAVLKLSPWEDSDVERVTDSPPAAPTGLTASAGTAQVTLSWTANTESDLNEYRLYRGTNPSPTTQIATLPSGTTSHTDTGLTNGTRYYYRLKAVDNAGNESGFSNEVNATPSAGPPPPEPVSPADGATGVAINPSFVWSSINSATAYDLQVATNSGFSSLIVSETGLTGTNRQVSGLVAGTTYFWHVRSANSAGPGEWFSPTRSFTTYPDIVNVNINRSFGSIEQTTSYRLVALPGNRTVALADAIGGTHNEDWVAYHEPGSDALVVFNGSATFNFRAGNGFWLLSKQTWNRTESVSTVPLSTGSNAIPLHSGWNIISNPLDVDVSWSAVQQANGITDALWRFSGSWSQSATFISAANGEAFYVLNQGLSELQIPYPGAGGVAASKTAVNDESEHPSSITLAVFNNGIQVSSVKVGFFPEAQSGLDAYDQFAPPGYFEAASLHLVNEQLESRYKELAEEYRPADVNGQAFDLLLRSKAGTSVTGHITGLADYANYEVYLVDLGQARFYDLHTQPVVTLHLPEEQSRYRLLIGSPGFIEAVQTVIVPVTYQLEQNYPNPFHPETVIAYALPTAGLVRLSVYNMLGQRVSVLVNGEERAGWHQVVWDGHNSFGQAVASGVYLYVLEAEDYREVRRMVYLR